MLRMLLHSSERREKRMGQVHGALVTLALAMLLAFSVNAQQSQIGAQAVNVQPLNAVASPTGVSAVSDFENGSTVRYYWVIAHSGGQASTPTSTSDTKGPTSLSNTVGFRVSVAWQTVTGTTYDVLESSTATLPNSLTCRCAVVTGTTNGQIFDTGNYSAYSTLPLLGFNFVFTNPLDGSGNPEVLVTYNNQTTPLCTFTSGTLSCSGNGGSCSVTGEILIQGGCTTNFTYTVASNLFVSNPNVAFTNTGAMNEYNVFAANAAPSTCPNLFTVIHPAFVATEAIAACETLPATAASKVWGNVFAGYLVNQSTGGLNNPGVTFSAHTNCTANTSACWSYNGVVEDQPSLTQPSLFGNEEDVVAKNGGGSGSRGAGFYAASFFTAQPAYPNLPAFEANNSGTGLGTWTSGFQCDLGATQTDCLHIEQSASGAGVNSQTVTVFAEDTSSATVEQVIQLNARHTFNINNHPIITAGVGGDPAGYGVQETATNNLAANELVKIDSSHADSVVPCTTTDTICIGFNAMKLAGGGSNGCNANDTFCGIITTTGSLAKGILGSGSCAIDNPTGTRQYVIPDPTTTGDVTCTSTPPVFIVGYAQSAQSSVGSTLDVLTAFQVNAQANVNGGTTTSIGTCPTAGTAYAQCSVVVPLNFTEPNTNYNFSCMVGAIGSTGNPWVYQATPGTSSITVTISNLSGALATASTPGSVSCTVTGT